MSPDSSEGDVLISYTPHPTFRIFMRFRSVLLLLLAAALAACRPPAATDARLLTPIELWELSQNADAASDQPIYLNPEAAHALGDSVPPPSPEEIAALPEPSRWRQLDRRHRYRAVLLAGQPASLRPLALHLLESPDFRLARIDNWGFLFLREAPRPYTPPSPDEHPAFPTPEEQATFLARFALHLDTAGFSSQSREYLTAARAAAPDQPDTLICSAYIDLQHNRLANAVAAADAALATQPDSPVALEIKAQALAAAGNADAAWQVAEQLLTAAAPDDMRMRFLHARLAKAAHAYSREQASLEQLIALARAANLSTTTYHVYLGQSYARQGLARPALEQFELALADPTLAAPQRTDLENTVANIRAKTNL